ncbi:hypothetical protein Taro_035570 [Colocasia esculenta]|uniref:Uncharacterized protein n=1 Tax=Colocasia esculenta TaxID=4460 RepID=A0A843WDL6_COLES|nr:hypothetical protein [Colocasia esculenta]
MVSRSIRILLVDRIPGYIPSPPRLPFATPSSQSHPRLAPRVQTQVGFRSRRPGGGLAAGGGRAAAILLRKMAKSARSSRRLSLRQFRSAPYPMHSCQQGCSGKEDHPEKPSQTIQKQDWEDATCSVCMEFPHNAVLLLCSSHDKGCRPYMCGTSYHFSNCLDLYKKAYTKVMSPHSQDHDSGVPGWPLSEKSEVIELACPLCRGQVKGWTVVEPARKYLNAKKRSCMQDNCTFVGTYRELRKHMRNEHPSAKPREVDPALEQKWRRLELEREQEDVMSVIRTSMPGAVVWGDYVLETGNNGAVPDDDEGDADRDGINGAISSFDQNVLRIYFLLRAYEDSRSASFASRLRRAARRSSALEGEEDGHHHFFLGHDTNDAVAAGASEGDDDEAPIGGTRQGRGLGRSERRRRRRRNSSGTRGRPIDID